MFAPVRKKKTPSCSTSSGEGVVRHSRHAQEIHSHDEEEPIKDGESSDNEGEESDEEVWVEQDQDKPPPTNQLTGTSESECSSDSDSDSSSSDSSSSQEEEMEDEKSEQHQQRPDDEEEEEAGSSATSSGNEGEDSEGGAVLPYHSDIEEFDSATESDDEMTCAKKGDQFISEEEEQDKQLVEDGSGETPVIEECNNDRELTEVDVSDNTPSPVSVAMVISSSSTVATNNNATNVSPTSSLSVSNSMSAESRVGTSSAHIHSSCISPTSSSIPVASASTPFSTTTGTSPSPGPTSILPTVISSSSSSLPGNPEASSSFSTTSLYMPTLNPLAGTEPGSTPSFPSPFPLTQYLPHLYSSAQRKAFTPADPNPNPSVTEAYQQQPTATSATPPIVPSTTRFLNPYMLQYMQFLQRQRQLLGGASASSMNTTNTSSVPSANLLPPLQYPFPVLPRLTRFNTPLLHQPYSWPQQTPPPPPPSGTVAVTTEETTPPKNDQLHVPSTSV